MIARFWSARSTVGQVPAYIDHLKTQVLPALRNVDGYCSAMLLERQTAEDVEIIVITFWKSLESIRAFAGDDLESAVVADEAVGLLTHFDTRVKHYRLVV